MAEMEPAARPDARERSTRWLISLTPMESTAGPASTSSLWKRLSRRFTTGEYVKEIENKGLRCKSSKYRNYPERIYLYASDKPLNKIPDIDKFIKTVTNPFDRQIYGLYVYRIDLSKMTSKTHINFYTDDCMNEEEAVYTYNNIPPECITRIDYEIK